VFLVAAAALAVPILVVSAAPLPQRPAAVLGAEFIRTTQQPDGGFGGFGPGQSMDAIYAIRAAGLDPNEVVNGGKTPADYLLSVAAEATDAGSAAKGALAARALGLNPRDVGGVNLVDIATSAYDPATGGYAEDAFTHSLVVIALTQLGVPAPTGAVLFLRDTQISDGGWGFGGASDPDTTGIAVQALAGAGVPATDSAIAAGIDYLRATQGNDGGWGFDPSESNASSTAFAVQALIAVGEDPGAWDKNGIDPIDYLLSIQQADGSFPGFDPAYATNQVVPALAGRSLGNAVDTPISAPPPPRQVAPGPPNTGMGLASEPTGAGAVLVGMLLMAALAGVRRREGVSRE
jgi:prenyltransferase beta subunit